MAGFWDVKLDLNWTELKAGWHRARFAGNPGEGIPPIYLHVVREGTKWVGHVSRLNNEDAREPETKLIQSGKSCTAVKQDLESIIKFWSTR